MYRFISCVAAACMVLYGYDASVFNSVQGSKNWMAWFGEPNSSVIGSINTAYTVGAIFGGFFLGGPIADYFGRKVGMGTGCVLVIISTFMQTFAPRGNLACFIAGRCIIGIGQGIALSTFHMPSGTGVGEQLANFTFHSIRPYLHWRACTC